MNENHQNLVPKVHPTAREVLPEDPMNLHGVEVPGDADLMLRLLVEEYARMGWGVDAIMRLAEDPFYQAFHGLYLALGQQQLRQRVAEVLARVGVTCVKTVETAPPVQLVSIDLPPRV